MKIKQKDGSMFEGDKIIQIETKGVETFPWNDLFFVINLGTINEVKRCKAKYSFNITESGYPLFFQKAVDEVMEFGKMGIDLTLDENVKHLESFCKKYQIKFNDMNQRRIEDFKE